jgi:hypothetical protein
MTTNFQPAFDNAAGAHTPDNLLGGDLRAVTESIIVDTGNLTRGTLLVKSGTKFVANAAAADATKVYAVLAEDTDATAADKTTVAYTTGMFNVTAMTLGATLAEVQDILRDKGIHLKTNQAF